MNTWNKVFLGLIFVTALFVAALASVEFHVRSTGQKHISSMETKIAETQEKIDRIVSGSAPQKHLQEKSPTEMSIEELRGILSGRYSERGRAWFDCVVIDVENISSETLQQVEVQVVVTGPFPPGVMPDDQNIQTKENEDFLVQFSQTFGVVYAFGTFVEGGDEIGKAATHNAFLGRFIVNPADTESKWTTFFDKGENQKNGVRINLITIDPIIDEEIEQIIFASRNADYRNGDRKFHWAIYMTSPVDRIAGIFSQLTEEEMQMIPEERRGKQDPSTLLDWLYQQQSGLHRDIRTAESNIEMCKDALKIIRKEIGKQLGDLIETEQNKIGGEKKFGEQFLASMQEKITEIEKRLKEKIEQGEKIGNEEDIGKMVRDWGLEMKRAKAMDKQRDAVKTLVEQREAEINETALKIEKMQTLSTAYVEGIEKSQLMAVEQVND